MGYKLNGIMMRPNGVEKQIRPKWEWQPGANTIAYYPLDTDFNDYSGNDKNLSTSSGNPTITTLGGVSCAYYNGSSISRNTSISAPIANRTILAWVNYTDTVNKRIAGIGSNVSSYGDYGLSGLQLNASLLIDDTCNGYGEAQTKPNGWFLYGVAQSGATQNEYINGELVQTITNLPTNGTSASGTMVVIGGKANYSFSEKYIGYISKMIVENRVRDGTDFVNYYNQTKGNYGL